MQIFRNDPRHVCRSHLFNASAIAFKEVCRISVILIRHTFTKDFIRRIKVEDERIEDRVFRPCDLRVRDRLLAQIVDLSVERLNGLDRGQTLGSHGELQNSRMIEVGSNSSAYAIRQSFRSANTLHQA